MANDELPTIFISYSHQDEDWKNRLKPFLKGIAHATDDQIVVWDDRQIDAGDKWYPEIRDALSRAAVAVCLVSEHFLASDFCVKEEVPYLLKRQEDDGILIILVLLRPCPWKSFRWIREHQLLPRDGKTVELDFRGKKAAVIFNQVAERIQQKFDDPSFIVPLPELAWLPLPEAAVDITRLPETGSELFGRQAEMNLLDAAWENAQAHVVVFKAWGGVGKSTLVRVWTEKMAEDNYRGAQRVFAWSFYSQGTGERVTSADQFIATALEFFGDSDLTAGSPWDKGERLAALVAQQRTLLLLDGMEPLQSDAEYDRGAVKDPALQTLLVNLARHNPGLCVISTRENVADLQDARFGNAVEHCDLEQVSDEAGRALLRVRGIQGTDGELERAVRAFGNHALAVNLLASYLQETAAGDISAADSIRDIDVPEERGRHPRRVVAAFESYFGESPEVQLLRILGLFDRPATKDEFAAVIADPPIPGLTDQLIGNRGGSFSTIMLPISFSLVDAVVLERLRRFGLIAPASKHRPDILDAHPIIREHFAVQLRKQYPDATREAQRRLYEHLKRSTPELPDNINDMIRLYHAMRHGCLAGCHQEVLTLYWDRVQQKLRGKTHKEFGLIGLECEAISWFFEGAWGSPVEELDPRAKAMVSRIAASRIRASGRPKEARPLAFAALKLYSKLYEDAESRDLAKQIAISARHSSELSIILGQVSVGLKCAEKAVEFAKKCEHEAEQGTAYSVLGNALHIAGRDKEAQDVFAKAERAHRAVSACREKTLYSLWGFRFCELLLDKKELDEVERRAISSLAVAQKDEPDYIIGLGLLDSPLAHLTLARSYLSRLQYEQPKNPLRESLVESAHGALRHAHIGFKSAAKQEFIPLYLLELSRLHRLNNNYEQACETLQEVYDCANKFQMMLLVIDICLEWTRLALTRQDFKLAQQKLDEANVLIKKTEDSDERHVPNCLDLKRCPHVGYRRRDDEIEKLQAEIDSASPRA